MQKNFFKIYLQSLYCFEDKFKNSNGFIKYHERKNNRIFETYYLLKTLNN